MLMGKLYQLLEGRMKELALFIAPMPPLTYFTGFVDIILKLTVMFLSLRHRYSQLYFVV